MIQLKNCNFHSSILSLFVTKKAALCAIVVKRHFPLPKFFSKILTSFKKDNVFLALKLTKLKYFTVYFSIFSMKISQILNINIRNIFIGIFYGYRHKIGWFWVESIWLLNDLFEPKCHIPAHHISVLESLDIKFEMWFSLSFSFYIVRKFC